MTLVKGGSSIAGFSLGIILLDITFPRAVGDIGNSLTFDFNVNHNFVADAKPQRVFNRDKTLLNAFTEAALDLQSMQVKAITTSCGFMALFQKQMVASLQIPFFSSSLMQIPFVAEMFGRDKRICLLTANSDSLTAEHLAGVDLDLEDYNVVIKGMQTYKNFAEPMVYNKPWLNEDKIREEMLEAATEMVEKYPDIAVFVLECTNMPPYAKAIQEKTGRPIFDIVTLSNFVQSCFVF